MTDLDNFVKDLLYILQQDAQRAKKEMANTTEQAYLRGILHGYAHVLTTIKNELQSFQIPEKDVGFSTDIERLLSKKR